MEIPFVDFAWFYLLKLSILALILYFIIKPVYSHYQEHGNFKIKKKQPYIMGVIFLILVILNPVKFDKSTQSEMTRKTYDPQIQQVEEIELRAKENYEAPSNEKEIDQLLNDKEQ